MPLPADALLAQLGLDAASSVPFRGERRWSGMTHAGPRPRFAMDTCPAEERQRAEAIVRDALKDRDETEIWMISLQRFHGGWDVFVDGPEPAVAAELRESLAGAGFTR